MLPVVCVGDASKTVLLEHVTQSHRRAQTTPDNAKPDAAAEAMPGPPGT